MHNNCEQKFLKERFILSINWKKLGLTTLSATALVLAACDTDDADTGENGGDIADQTITGIEAGAGVVNSAEQAIEDYDLDGWDVQTSSSGAMVTELRTAYQNEEEIVITGWSPHWKFQEFDLKYLEDPEGSFGAEETIDTFVREGLEEDSPEAYQVLDNFEWTLEDMEEVMLDIEEHGDDAQAARDWVDANEDVVSEWTDGVDEVDGESITLSYVNWDSEVASTNVVATVLEDLGFEVTQTQLDNAIMWESVANGEADGMVAAWLPGTHEAQYDEYAEDMVHLGTNLEGARIGLVVPEYMDIDSIEDLQGE